MSPFKLDGPEPPLHCRRFAYGYALDGSECPSYLVWPQRDGQFCTLLDTSTTDTLPLNRDFFRPLGMEHFYDSFALVSQISLHLFGLREDELLHWQAMARGTGKPTPAVRGWQLSRWFLGEQHSR